MELSDGSTIGGMLFADDFVGVSNSEEELQRLINVAHVKRVLQNGRKKISQVHSNRDIDLTARRLLLISVVRPTLEYGSEVWEGNKAQAAALESEVLSASLDVRQGPVMRLLEVTWGWIHYRVVEIRRS